MRRIVADLGNSRLKWAESSPHGPLSNVHAPPLDPSGSWLQTIKPAPGDLWAISTVNPGAAEALSRHLESHGISSVRWFRSAADVSLKFGHSLSHPERTGADRALGVVQVLDLLPPETGGVVVSVGSALVVERIAPGGQWQGGAITAGLGPLARALRQSTAQLPEVVVGEPPPSWGFATDSALSAGLFWGLVGSARELIARQKATLSPAAWTLWTGGDAPRIAPWIDGPDARIVPDLVLQALARIGFESNFRSSPP